MPTNEFNSFDDLLKEVKNGKKAIKKTTVEDVLKNFTNDETITIETPINVIVNKSLLPEETKVEVKEEKPATVVVKKRGKKPPVVKTEEVVPEAVVEENVIKVEEEIAVTDKVEEIAEVEVKEEDK